MPNFWDNKTNVNTNKNGFNIQEFMKFANQMKGKDPNQMLQQMMNNGQITQQQLENAQCQANDIYKTLQTIGIIK